MLTVISFDVRMYVFQRRNLSVSFVSIRDKFTARSEDIAFIQLNAEEKAAIILTLELHAT